MSRIGREPISIPSGVEITIDDQKIIIKGKYAHWEYILSSQFDCEIKENKFYLINKSDKNQLKKYYGLTRSLLANKILGAAEPFKKTLITKGVGYKFQVSANKLIISAGYSHPVEFVIPEAMTADVEANTKLTLTCNDKEALGLFAAQIRQTRPPEPYKGKGIMYENEKIIRKVGKSGKK